MTTLKERCRRANTGDFQVSAIDASWEDRLMPERVR